MPASYTKLWTYRFSVIIHDFTIKFCKRYILSRTNNLSPLGKPDYRLADQMIQAARSGKQNIAEGSENMATSYKMAIKLTNVAKSSLAELLEDYQDFLRQQNLLIWPKTDSKLIKIRKHYGQIISNLSDLSNLRNLQLPGNHEVAANTMLTLCHQATYLLHKQVVSMENKHTTEGGFTERLYNKRKQQRGY